MAIQNRTVTIKDVFAKNANTTIPEPPVVGISYRNESLTAAEVGEGWPFKEIVDSAKFNEAMYEYTTICKQLETYGFLPWCASTDYETGSLCLGTDGIVYQAKQPTGPSTTAYNPVNDASHTYWEEHLESVTRRAASWIYKVGSIYASAVDENPSITLGFGTWSLLTSSVVIGTSATAPVKGNGNALGLYNGSTTAMMTQTGNGTAALNATRGLGVGGVTYVEAAGAGDGTYAAANDGKAIGVSPDASKSGLIADTSNVASKITVYLWQRIA